MSLWKASTTGSTKHDHTLYSRTAKPEGRTSPMQPLTDRQRQTLDWIEAHTRVDLAREQLHIGGIVVGALIGKR